MRVRPAAPCTRREAIRDAALALGSLALGSLALGACSLGPGPAAPPASSDGRLTAVPTIATRSDSPGTYALGLGLDRDGLLFIPAAASTSATPLVLLLHGAGGSGQAILEPVRPLAESLGLAVLAVDARAGTWDTSLGGFGPDVDFIERALLRACTRVAVDPARLTIAGFSDGASYALSLGAINGDLFRRVAAFSPGYWARGTAHGTPSFFVTHGVADGVLPIDLTSRRLVPELRAAGYDVTYREFEGGHAISRTLLEQAAAWLAA